MAQYNRRGKNPFLGIGVIDHNANIETFLSATASARPVPAGGSCAALAGALAGALGQMVMHISAGKDKLASFHPQQRIELQQFANARQTLMRLIMDDQTAFASLLAARRLSHDDPDRPAAIEQAVAECIQVPQSLASEAVDVLESCDHAVEMSHSSLLADLSACADLAMAAVRIGTNLVRVNAKELGDLNRRAMLNKTVDEMLARGVRLVQNVNRQIRVKENK